MSTRDYLRGLDIDQLRFARDEASRLIEEKLKQEKVPVWVVADDYLNYAAFELGRHSEAVDRLVAEIKAYAEKNPGQPVKLWLIKSYFFQDEAEQILNDLV